MNVNGKPYRTVWFENRRVMMINQHLLPERFEIAEFTTPGEVAEAIKDMTVRGAPAIGAAAAYGLALAALEAPERGFDGRIAAAAKMLAATRPTAQNLFRSIDRVTAAINRGNSVAGKRKAASEEAERIADEDVAACRAIGRNGAALLKDGMRVLTHCNAGWLATVDWGTALSPIYTAGRNGIRVTVLADETRPRGQGARLTAWELMQEGVPVEIIADNAAGHLMRTGCVDLCIVGADRVAANGDVANKIGTYEKAVLARENSIPFYVAAPLSTFDPRCATGAGIPIEERAGDEVLWTSGWTEDGRLERVRTTPQGARARNPAFDVTPAKYITGIITEKGVTRMQRPTDELHGGTTEARRH